MPTTEQVAPETAAGSASAPAPGDGARVRLPVAVLVVVATLVVALLAVGLVVRVDAERLPVGPALDPPAAPPEVTAFTVDDRRTARFQEFSIILAGAPYRCGDTPAPPAGFTAYVGCSHVVHGDYDRAGDDWSAVTGVLLVGDALVRPGDLTATTTAVFESLVRQLYSPDDHPVLREASVGDVRLTVPDDRYASRFGDVHVRVKGLATPYDRLVVVVVELPSGRHVAFFSDYPHDGGRAGVTAVSTSVNTISLQR